jgi:hypothetical protein
VDKRQFAVRLTAEAPSIARLLASFHGGLEEITLVALPEGSHRPVHVNSFIDPQKGGWGGVGGRVDGWMGGMPLDGWIDGERRWVGAARCGLVSAAMNGLIACLAAVRQPLMTLSAD